MSYSVVIPTMWVPDTFQTQLQSLVECVDEILIIDNRVASRPAWDVLNHPKIQLLPQAENIYVNPAWNLGVAMARHDWICLLNDDLLFDTQIFSFLEPAMSPEVGVIGLYLNSQTAELGLQPTSARCWAFGCLMFLHKQNYPPIPEQLKVLYGDDYIFQINKRSGRRNYMISGLSTNRVVSATCGSSLIADAIGMFQAEMAAYESLGL